MQKKTRTGYDLSDWFRDNPESSLEDFISELEKDPHTLSDKKSDLETSKIRRVWTVEELINSESIYMDAEPVTEPASEPTQEEPPEYATMAPPDEAEDTKPDKKIITLHGPHHEQVRDAIAALNPDMVFKQGGNLVRIVKTDKQTISIMQYNHVSIQETLSRFAYWQTYKKGKDGRAEAVPLSGPSDKISKAVIAHGEYPDIMTIRGVTETPFIRKDGSICSTHGFDKSSGFFLNMRAKPLAIPDEPQRFEAAEAYLALREPFEDFPFVDERSRAVPIAAILSVMARPMLGNIPAFMIDASSPGSGKTFCSDIISIILTGKKLAKTTWPRGREKNTELEKIMNSVALMGAPLLCFDNLQAASSFGGTVIESFITSNGVVTFRKLGGNDFPTLPYNTVMIVNGNNLLDSIETETRRRVLPCRMVPDCERPQDRSSFKHDPIFPWVEKNRSRLITAGLTLLRYAIQNPAEIPQRWGSFEEFAAVVPHAIMAAGGPDILSNRELAPVSGGDENESLIGLFEVLEQRFYNGFLSSDVIRQASSSEELRDALENVFYGGIPTIKQFGKKISASEDRIFDGIKVIKDGKLRRSTKWRIVRVDGQAQNVIDFNSAMDDMPY